MRTLADQSVEKLGGQGSILHRQEQDHVTFDRMLERLPDTGGEEQNELLTRICRSEQLSPLRRGERPETHLQAEEGR